MFPSMQPVYTYPSIPLRSSLYDFEVPQRFRPINYNSFPNFLFPQQQFRPQNFQFRPQNFPFTKFFPTRFLAPSRSPININEMMEKMIHLTSRMPSVHQPQISCSDESNTRLDTDTRDSVSPPSKPSASKKISKSKTMLCPHTHREHFAKGLCKSCYLKIGRTKKPSNCSHDHLYAKGLCQKCYMVKYRLNQKTSPPIAKCNESDNSSNDTLSTQIKCEADH